MSVPSTAVSEQISKGIVRLSGGCDYAQMLKLFSQTQRETAFSIQVLPVMSVNRSSENDLEVLGGGGGGCVLEGIEEKTVAGRSLEIQARPDREGPAPSTRNPEKGARWFRGSAHKVLGSQLPCSLHLLNVTSGSGFAPAQNLSHVSGFPPGKLIRS